MTPSQMLTAAEILLGLFLVRNILRQIGLKPSKVRVRTK